MPKKGNKKKTVPIPHLSADAQEFCEELERETDRGAALVGAAFLDDVLASMLAAVLVKGEKVVEDLLGADRPLGTFGARIHVANYLGLLGPDMRHDLDLIRKIRNEFAHLHGPASFASERLAEWCREIRACNILPRDWHALAVPRHRFTWAVALLANQLMLRGLSLKHAEPGKDFRSERGS